MTIIVDPYLISIPNRDHTNKKEVSEYAERLLTWDNEFRSQPKKYVMSGWALSEIYKQELAPNKANLQALFDQFGLDHYSAHDIVPTCSGVMANTPYLEKITGADKIWNEYEIECVEDSEVIVPEELIERIHPVVASEFINALIYSGYALAKQKGCTVLSIASASVPNKQVNMELLVEATIETINESVVTVSRRWPILFDPDYRYVSMNVADFVYQEESHLATIVAWCKMKQEGMDLERLNRDQFRFGNKFIESLTCKEMTSRPNFEKELEQTFRAIVHVLGNIWSYGSDKHHALRQSIQNRQTRQQVRKHRDGSGAKQTDKAARVEVTAGKTPLRLHYWQCFDGTYEFSNVTTDHDDPTIYY